MGMFMNYLELYIRALVESYLHTYNASQVLQIDIASLILQMKSNFNEFINT